MDQSTRRSRARWVVDDPFRPIESGASSTQAGCSSLLISHPKLLAAFDWRWEASTARTLATKWRTVGHDARRPSAAAFARAGAAAAAPHPPLAATAASLSPNDLEVEQKQQGSQAGHQQRKLSWRQASVVWIFVQFIDCFCTEAGCLLGHGCSPCLFSR